MNYAYRCNYCGHVFESVSKPHGMIICPYCGSKPCVLLESSGVDEE